MAFWLKFIFYSFAMMTVVAAILMIFTKNVLYAAFLLLCVFLGVSVIYIFLGADFLAITQIIVYVGGVLVLLLFGIMLTNKSTYAGSLQTYQAPQTGIKNVVWVVLCALAFFILLIQVIYEADFENALWVKEARAKQKLLEESSISTLGVSLMTWYILAFELVAILLLIALIGALMIAQKKKEN